MCTGMRARFRRAGRLLHASVDTFVESSCAWTKIVGEAKGDKDGDIALRSVTMKPSGAVPIARLTLWEKWPGDESIRLAWDNHEGRLNDAPQVFSEWNEGG